MRAIRPTLGLACLATVSAVPLLAIAQQPTPEKNVAVKTAPAKPVAPLKLVPPDGQIYAGLTFSTNVGSFKFVPIGETPTQGDLTVSFTGTILISGLEPGSTVTVTGAVRKEFDDPKLERTVYHGTGTLKFHGKAHGIQFFGRDMKARFFGLGIVRLYGEFDKNLNTGTYKYDGQPSQDWLTGGRQLVIPSREQSAPTPKVRINPGKG